MIHIRKQLARLRRFCVDSGATPGLAWWVLWVPFHRWSRHPSGPLLAKAMDDSGTGGRLRKAQARLDEIVRLERD